MHKQAEQDYLAGMKYKEIAEKYNVSINTVKSWKQRHGWERNKGAPKEKSVHTKKEDASKKESVILSDDLTDKQRLFCIYYLKYFNATKAYQKAYECDYVSAMSNGSRLLRNDKVNAEIDRLKAEQANELKLDVQDVIQKYIDIAFADITDFVEFGTEEIPGGELEEELTGVDQSYIANYVRFKSDQEVDGTIISEVKKGKDGVAIKLADKMKALAALEKYVGFMSEEQKLKVSMMKLEVDKMKAENSEEVIEDDGFFEALESKVSEVWDDAEES